MIAFIAEQRGRCKAKIGFAVTLDFAYCTIRLGPEDEGLEVLSELSAGEISDRSDDM